jgi:hypothetical protein
LLNSRNAAVLASSTSMNTAPILKPVAPQNDEPIFLSHPLAKAVKPRFGLGAQANIRSTM